jgi:hypothetical protein
MSLGVGHMHTLVLNVVPEYKLTSLLHVFFCISKRVSIAGAGKLGGNLPGRC